MLAETYASDRSYRDLASASVGGVTPCFMNDNSPRVFKIVRIWCCQFKKFVLSSFIGIRFVILGEELVD